jgi:hypothetical protein
MAKKTAAKKTAGRKKTAARKSVAKKAGGQRRETLTRARKNVAYAKRRADGTFKEIDEVGRSLAQDRRTRAKTTAKKGYRDRGDG